MNVDVPTKSALSSATVWFNIATVALVVLGALADNALSLGIPPAVLAYIAVANGVINTLLRIYKTSLPIGEQGGTKTVEAPLPKEIG